MHDPIGAFKRTREHYISYLETAFRISDTEVAEERRRLLREPGVFAADPLLEPLPSYRPSDFAIEDLLEADTPDSPLGVFGREGREAAVRLALNGLFPSKPDPDHPAGARAAFPPFTHQIEMLRRGVRGRPAVVTSGTGSGKTEAFLLPILSSIAAEATSWSQPEDGYREQPWWQRPGGGLYLRVDDSGRLRLRYGDLPPEDRPRKSDPTRTPYRPERAGERRPAAMRALIIYPMNALVEDQMVRLRKSLDSLEAREFMSGFLGDNRIYFGRYTSATPVTGFDVHPELETLKRWAQDDPEAEEELDRQLARRRRRLREMLQHFSDTQLQQEQVRRHAAAHANLTALRERLGRPGSTSHDTFLQALDESGHCPREGLVGLYRDFVGTPSEQVEREIHAANPEPPAQAPLPRAGGEDTPFLFSSVDGGEMTTRWDMQAHPPDVLITNISMLSAMLNREVESPVFDATREWLKRDDAYFYLVVDELHLQRGAAGTEVAYLLRVLLERLGLTSSAEQRSKLRVLASSASLPTEPEENARRSSAYLRDMFGTFGLSQSTDGEEPSQYEAWLDAIIPGEQVSPPRGSAGPLDHRPFKDLQDHLTGRDGARDDRPIKVEDPQEPSELALWNAVAAELGIDHQEGSEPPLTEVAVRAGNRLVAACQYETPRGTETRATALADIARTLFPDADARERESALRGLLIARGAVDPLGIDTEARSFRMHTFFRSPEGLFASPTSDGDSTRYRFLNFERTPYHTDEDDGTRWPLFELLYCEACGELFVGGMRGRVPTRSHVVAELRANESELEGLPDESATTAFEDLSWSQYVVFWPRDRDPKSAAHDIPGADPFDWTPARLDVSHGILRNARSSPAEHDLLGRYLYHGEGQDRHGRRRKDAGSAVPYICPACGTSYKGRSQPYRLSPIRNFRAGFQRTTQLLASETFEVQGLNAGARAEKPKLVSFSDSRQDAARTALGIERRHHADLRRLVLVEEWERLLASVDSEAREARIEALQAALKNELPEVARDSVQAQLDELLKERGLLEERIVALRDVLERFSETSWREEPTRPVTRRLALLGVHPGDDAGAAELTAKIDERTERFEWPELFGIDERGRVIWRHAADPAADEPLRIAQQDLLRNAHLLLTEVIFSKTYFSLEEVGFGYPIVPLGSIDESRRSADWQAQLAAVMRVLGDCYRYHPNPYHRRPQDRPSEILTPGQAPARLRRFAEDSWGTEWSDRMEDALVDLRRAGHSGGLLNTEALYVRLLKTDAPYVRCPDCSRVHTHVGTGRCTRCRAQLNWDGQASGRAVAELRSSNFLAADFQSAEGGEDGAFRLHCEELTGQTVSPEERQRNFKGILIPPIESGDLEGDVSGDLTIATPEVDQISRASQEIDLLAVTTTMEVGIDIGALQTVLQANMPPQRFNYQQRVGRAGRRGQAFSLAVTLCRSKSHDLHYFRHTSAITGEPPPVPFLTKNLPPIPTRLLRKELLRRAFSELRKATRSDDDLFPTDWAQPDIHGEFLPREYWNDPGWRERTRSAIEAGRANVGGLVDALSDAAPIDVDVPSTEALLSEMDEASSLEKLGLAECLAEAGYLPMYGLPTRVRNLYRGLEREFEGQREWLTTDRDLDIAIYEFAPGSILVIDKKEHLCVGFTPELAPPIPSRDVINALGDGRWASEQFWLVQCTTCHSWRRIEQDESGEPMECDACGSQLNTDSPHHCVVPTAFRTNFQPDVGEEEPGRGVRHRSIHAEARPVDFAERDLSEGRRIKFFLDQESRTFRLNNGPILGEGEERGFLLTEGTDKYWNYSIPHQAVVPSYAWRLRDAQERERPVFLAAPKVTTGIHLTPAQPDPEAAWSRIYSIGRLDEEDMQGGPPDRARWIGVRAAGVSATAILINRIAQDLDVDPDEFDALEPRPIGTPPVMSLEFTDELVNGSGLCQFLGTAEREETSPRIGPIIESIVTDPDVYPLDDFLDPEHRDHCATSCYVCLQRYGNQAYHGLLDWKLGLAVLRGLIDPSYRFGLDADDYGQTSWTYLPEIEAWKREGAHLASELAGEDGAVDDWGGLPAFRRRYAGEMGPWVIIVHPMWETDAPHAHPRLTEAVRMAEEDCGLTPQTWDSFNLARRRTQVLEWIRLGM